jgi:excinuclease ABC subunit C
MKKADYRRFKIQTVIGANDFASMQEVIMRRYGDACGEPSRTSEHLARPDLILIDGGLGQLAAAMEGLKQIGHQDLAMIGLAKARGEKDERIFLPGRKNPIMLRANSPATHLVQRIRDEAHRFAISFHRKLRGKALMVSQLDQVSGIGEITRTRLLKQYGSLANIAAASDNELTASGLDAKTVAEMRKALAHTTPSRS